MKMDFYTYGGFTETVDAFKRLALIFNDNEYITLIGVAIVLGFLFGGLHFIGKQFLSGLSNQNISLNWMFAVLLGVLIFKGLILPKGTLHIYDPIKNEYQAIDKIPNLILLIAGVTNKFERTIIRILDHNSAYPYKSEAGGISFKLLYHLTATDNTIDNYYLNKNLKRYYRDCAPMANVLPSSSFEIDDLKHNVTDYMALLAKLRSPSEYTVLFSNKQKSGQSQTCQAAWDSYLKPALLDKRYFDGPLKSVCGRAGFNVNSQKQLLQCEKILSGLNKTAFESNQSGGIHVIRNTGIAKAIAGAMLDENPDVGMRTLANRSVMLEGVGVFQTANDWMPTIRASVIAIILGLSPLLICFLVTPLMGKSLSMLLGLFAWLTLWGIADAMIHSIAMDQAIAAMAEVKRHKMGITGILLAPEGALKALAIFGKARGMGIVIATFLAHFLFRISSYAFAQMAGGWSNQIDQKGEQAAFSTQTPEGQGARIGQLTESYAAGYNVNQMGFPGYANASTFNKGAELKRADTVLESGQNQGMGMDQAINTYGSITGAAQFAGISATSHAASMMGLNPGDPQDISKASHTVAEIEQSKRAGDALALDKAYKELGEENTLQGQKRFSYLQAMESTSRNQSLAFLSDQIKTMHQNNTGQSMSDKEAYRTIAETTLSPLSGDVKATLGDAKELTDFYKQHRAMSLASLQGMESAALEFGKTLPELAKAEGMFKSSGQEAHRQALEVLTPQDVVAGYMTSSIKQGMDGQAWKNIAGSYEGGQRALFEDIANYKTNQEFASLLAFSHMAETMNKSNEDMAFAMQSSGFRFSVGESDIKPLLDNNMITQKQADILSQEGGGVINASFDPKSGLVVNASAHTGQSLSVDSSTKEEHSESYIATKTHDTRTMTGAGNDFLSPNTAPSLLLNDKEEAHLESILKDIEGNAAAKENFIMNAAGWLGRITTPTVSESQRFHSDITAHTAAQWGTPGLFSTATGGSFSVGAKASAGVSGIQSETDVHNTNYRVVTGAFEEARTTAKELAQQKQALSFEDREKYYYEQFADTLNNKFSHIVENYRNENLKFTKDSEFARENSEPEPFDNNKLSLRAL